MGRGKARYKLRIKNEIMTLRIDAEAKSEFREFAKSQGFTASALLLASIRHMLREEKVDFPLPGKRIPVSRIEQAARRRRARDEGDFIDWSKFDAYDG